MDSDGRKAPEADDGDLDDEGIVIDDENPEWTEEDFRRARPLLEVLPKEVVEAMRRYRGQRGRGGAKRRKVGPKDQ